MNELDQTVLVVLGILGAVVTLLFVMAALEPRPRPRHSARTTPGTASVLWQQVTARLREALADRPAAREPAASLAGISTTDGGPRAGEPA
ncbi:MAG: hypothetical protein HOQ45_03010 [Nocardioidaceae bacterium]|nr:hypothetical protein [Nocardioidaceae bacterium]